MTDDVASAALTLPIAATPPTDMNSAPMGAVMLLLCSDGHIYRTVGDGKWLRDMLDATTTSGSS